MIIEKQTYSVCPVCLGEIPAIVRVSNQDVRILKTCTDHGSFDVVIETDPIFYMLCDHLDTGNLYNGLFVDVTHQCNTTCKYCYHDVRNEEPSREGILEQCQANSNLAPFIMFGGEPTMRNDLPDLLRDIRKIGPVVISTNGLKMADMGYVKCLDALTDAGIFYANISLNPRASNAPGDYEKKIKAIENVLSTGLMLYGLSFVIDSIEQIDEAIAINREYKGRIDITRIRIATAIDQTQQGCDMFNSDIYTYLSVKAKTEGVSFDINHSVNNKALFFNMIYDGVNFAAVKFHNKFNVDLTDIDCGPWQVNKNGRIINMNHSLILGG